jgi:hypothetical protein
MRDTNSPIIEASEIVSNLVTWQVQLLFNYERDQEHLFPFAMNQIHRYLSTHLDILSKKFVFFSHNEKDNHWWGWVAINPWVQIAKILH